MVEQESGEALGKASDLSLVLGVPLDGSQLCMAVSKLALIPVAAGGILAPGAAQLSLHDTARFYFAKINRTPWTRLHLTPTDAPSTDSIRTSLRHQMGNVSRGYQS